MAVDAHAWSLVIPVKALDIAKSRLAVPGPVRREIALAMASDTVTAALASREVAEVVVVTDDPAASKVLSDLGARILADEPADGLNPALRHGIQQVTQDWVAALSSDLPALTATELDDVLRAAAALPTAVVADTSGHGTTVLAATDRRLLAPAFGPDSRRAHRLQGAVDITRLAAPSVRRDVDTLAELAEAVSIGVGVMTRAAVAQLSL